MQGSELLGAFWKLAKRIAAHQRTTWVLILTDHDRAGYNMTDFGEDTLTNLVGKACGQFDLPMPVLKFDRIGLDEEQVRRYGIATRPPKGSHPGMKNQIEECAEVDFLRAEQIEEIMRDGIERHLDTGILERTRRQQAVDIGKLRRVAELWDDLDQVLTTGR